jgi:hypothetical protein
MLQEYLFRFSLPRPLAPRWVDWFRISLLYSRGQGVYVAGLTPIRTLYQHLTLGEWGLKGGGRVLTLQGKSHLCIPFLGIARPQSQFRHSCVSEQFIYSQYRSTYFPAAEQADQSWKYINLSQIYECMNWETKHYNCVLEIIDLGIHK